MLAPESPGSESPSSESPGSIVPASPRSVLFVCGSDGNRAIMAAALARHHAPRQLQASWAHGPAPQVHPYALVVLSERGLSPEGLCEYLLGSTNAAFDLTVNLAQEHEPDFLGQCPPGRVLHCPARPPQSPLGHTALQLFRSVRDELEHTVVRLLDAAGEPLQGAS